jgi:hypothetical protein
VFPGATEACNAKDDDCDGLRDEECPAPEPVLQLSFEGNVEDASPNGLDGTWSEGAGSYAAGHEGQAIALAGGDSPFVVVAESDKLGGMGRFSASVWAKKNSSTGGTIYLKHVCYTLGVGADSVNAYVQTDEGQADLNVYSGVPIDDTEWHHYLVTYDSTTGEAALYVDGVEVSSAVAGGFVRYDPCDPRELNVGRDPWGDSFDGLIDELVIYDAVVTP